MLPLNTYRNEADALAQAVRAALRGGHWQVSTDGAQFAVHGRLANFDGRHTVWSVYLPAGSVIELTRVGD